MHYFLVGKRVLTCLVFAAVMWGASESFAASDVSIKVKARSESNDDDGEIELETEQSFATTAFQTETEVYTLQINLKNNRDQKYKGVLQWCFISDHSTGDTYDEEPIKAVLATFSPGKKEIVLSPGAALNESMVSEPFVFEEKTVETEWYDSGDTTTYEYETGDVYKGYVLFFTVNGEVLAQSSNSSRYLKDEWIEKCSAAIKEL